MNVVLINEDYLIENTSEYAVCLGRFDGVHKGHRELILKTVSYARENNLRSGAVTFIRNYEKDKIYPLDTQMKIMEELGIDTLFVIVFNEKFKNTSSDEFVEKYIIKYFKAKCVVCGFNFKFGKNREGSIETLKEYDKYFTLFVIPPVYDDKEIVSSSLIKKLMAEGNIKRANSLLGRKFEITGVVSEGNKIGRTINFPTANIIVESSQCEIKAGVYSSYTNIGKKKYLSISNIGVAPTVRNGEKIILETNIMEYNEILYNKDITVSFVDFIRGEKKFKDINDLKNTICCNIETAKEHFNNDF